MILSNFVKKVISLCIKWLHSSPSYLLVYVSPCFLSNLSSIKYYFEQNVKHVLLDDLKVNLQIISIEIAEEFWVVRITEKE